MTKFMEQDQSVTPKSSAQNEIWEWVKAIAIAAALVFIIRYFVFAPFIVDGPSMQPNFYTGERLIVNKLVYEFRKPHRGEVIVFHAKTGKDYIKRVIALPGETIKIAGNKVYINNQELDEPYIKEAVEEYSKKGGGVYNGPFSDYKVPEGTIFAMGDNRPDSSDSRVLDTVGPVPYGKIVGRADLIFWPLDKIKLVKHHS
ncbi:signal peptidase I [Paenibacillus cymbidii]|uniref:signal peptidase I n=1 Tax=Paenibacillus cymbidii TaxID=1639034 RepID=UPI0038B3174F